MKHSRILFEIHRLGSFYCLRIVRQDLELGRVVTGEEVVCESVDEARSHIPGGARHTPTDKDPQSLVEVWE